MKNQIIIHAAGKQTRIALIENGELAQFFIESPENQRTVGDIYLAEVHKVMSGIRAAFIDMGTPKDAFLHFSDVGDNLEDYIKMLNGTNSIPQPPVYKNGRKEKDNEHHEKMTPGLEKQLHVGEILAPAQKLLVQIVKEPIGSKGPRVSTDITLAGRFLVLVPLGDYIGVSKRIRSYKERRRLRNIISSNLPEGFGVIVRTVADGQKEEVIKRDLQEQLNKWEDILSKIKVATPPALLYRDLDMTESLIRDLFAKDYNRLLIDDPKMYRSIKNYVADVAPQMLPNIELYKGSEHIFDYMKISQDVESIFSPRVKMPSGGYLIFEQTEAMYVIDVNSGRYAAKKHQEDNSLRTNLEASREIAKQLRLRDIGGIIVVDFIDLRDDTNRKKVYDELKKEFKKDRAKTNILPMSDFGLVQITRQRIRPSVVNSVSRICPMCGGSGSVVSQNTIVSDIEAWLTKFKYTTHYRAVDLYINPYLKSFLTRGLFSQQVRWMFRYHLKISLIADETISLNDYKFTLSGSEVDITEAVLLDQPLEEAIKKSHELDALEGHKGISDKSNLDVFETPKKEKTSRNVKHVAKPETTNKKPDKKEYYQEQKNGKKDDSDKNKSAQSKEPVSSRKSTTSQGSRTGHNEKISKYYKSHSKDDSSRTELSDSTKHEKDLSSSDSSKNQAKTEETQVKEEPRSALEVAREYRLQQMKEAEKAEEKAPAQSGVDHSGSKQSETDPSEHIPENMSDTEQSPGESDKSAKKSIGKDNLKGTPNESEPVTEPDNNDASTTKKTEPKSRKKPTVKKTTTKKKTAKTSTRKKTDEIEKTDTATKKTRGRPRKTAAKKISQDTDTPKKVTKTRKTTKKSSSSKKPLKPEDQSADN